MNTQIDKILNQLWKHERESVNQIRSIPQSIDRLKIIFKRIIQKHLFKLKEAEEKQNHNTEAISQLNDSYSFYSF